MPIYEYRCANGHTFEAFQSFSDAPLETCEECGAKVQKVLSAPALHFKGSGFYTTDYGKGKAPGRSPLVQRRLRRGLASSSSSLVGRQGVVGLGLLHGLRCSSSGSGSSSGSETSWRISGSSEAPSPSSADPPAAWCRGEAEALTA